MAKTITERCLECDKYYEAKRTTSRFCSPKCRLRYWTKNNPRVKKEEK